MKADRSSLAEDFRLNAGRAVSSTVVVSEMSSDVTSRLFVLGETLTTRLTSRVTVVMTSVSTNSGVGSGVGVLCNKKQREFTFHLITAAKRP